MAVMHAVAAVVSSTAAILEVIAQLVAALVGLL
jgi:hypothetical protein